MYMSWQIALVFNIIFATIRGFLDKKLVQKIDPFVLYFYVVFWGGIFFALFYFIRHSDLPIIYPPMIFLGVLYSFAVVAYLHAIKISLSQSVVFSPYSVLVSMLLSSLFLGEWQLFNLSTFLGQKTLSGVILAFLGLRLILVSHLKKEERLERRWFYFVTISTLLMGIGNFISKAFLITHGPLETLVSQTIGGVPTLLLLSLTTRRKLSLSFADHLLVMVNGSVMFFAVTFFYVALKAGPLTLILPIQTLILTVSLALVGLIIYQETHMLTKEKLIGLVVGIIGAGLLVI